MASIQEYLQETPSKLLEIIEKGDRLFSSIKKEKITRIFLQGLERAIIPRCKWLRKCKNYYNLK